MPVLMVAQGAALGQQLRPGGAMNRPIDAIRPVGGTA